jgi:hypothetical protein
VNHKNLEVSKKKTAHNMIGMFLLVCALGDSNCCSASDSTALDDSGANATDPFVCSNNGACSSQIGALIVGRCVLISCVAVLSRTQGNSSSICKKDLLFPLYMCMFISLIVNLLGRSTIIPEFLCMQFSVACAQDTCVTRESRDCRTGKLKTGKKIALLCLVSAYFNSADGGRDHSATSFRAIVFCLEGPCLA